MEYLGTKSPGVVGDEIPLGLVIIRDCYTYISLLKLLFKKTINKITNQHHGLG